MRALIVIPARYGSTRFPAKPLHPIAGRTLLERVVALAEVAVRGLAGVDIVVATDHAEIAAHARAIGCAAAMTESALSSGTSRALAAARERDPPPDVVLNLQGDAPFVPAGAIGALLRCMASADDDVATPVVALRWADLDRLREHKRTSPSSGTTCVRAPDGRALWFSKAIIPALRGEAGLRAAGEPSPVLRHLGLYAYRMAALEAFEAAGPSRYETLEGLEQLRLLELGLTIRTVEVEPQHIPISGIDTPADARLAEALIAELGDPHVEP